MTRWAAAAGVAAGATALGAAYWRHMAPYSQAIGTFPHQADGADGHGSRPVVALTFDDGPNEPYTSQIVGLLEERGLRGTFFQVGRCVQRHPGLSRDLADRGHVVGNHSFSHSFMRGWTEEAVSVEIDEAEDALSADLGRRPLLYRPPWLIRTKALFRVLQQRGMTPVGGEFCHPLEPFQPPPARIADRASKRARPGRILIFHDGYDDRGGYRGSTVGAVARVLDDLQSRGYDFATVDQMLGVAAYQ